MTVAPRSLALRAQVLEELRERGIVGDDADRHPVPGDGRHHGVVAADMADRVDQPAPGARRRCARSSSTSMYGTIADISSARPRRQAHQLDEVAPVLVIGAQRQPADARVVGRQAEDVPEVAVRPAPLAGPGQVRALDGGADDLAGEALGDHVGQPRGRLVRDDRQTLDDAGAAAPASMRSLESALAGSAAGRSASAVGHFAAAVATWAFVPASLRYVRLASFSVPTRVSSSSPRMNASTRLNAMSSWICCGGLFMK